MKEKLTSRDWGLMIGQGVAIFGDLEDVGVITGSDINHFEINQITYNYSDNHRPILRDISQMTGEESEKAGQIINILTPETAVYVNHCAAVVDYFDLIGVDIRGWINADLAVKKEDKPIDDKIETELED